ncbi:hypothetical protein, partial [Terriglobus sp. ADX1]|uniref:hypothetical protein n=1 Tax=Terriglobus sp. ADX1 TaxID=2794063 RepID=UPI002FE630BE
MSTRSLYETKFVILSEAEGPASSPSQQLLWRSYPASFAECFREVLQWAQKNAGPSASLRFAQD